MRIAISLLNVRGLNCSLGEKGYDSSHSETHLAQAPLVGGAQALHLHVLWAASVDAEDFHKDLTDMCLK